MKVHFCYDLNQAQKMEWNQFWEKCQHSHLRQHFLLGEVERAKGRIPIYVAGKVDDVIVCIAIFSIRPLFSRKRFSLEAVCLRGPAFDNITYAKEFIPQIARRFKTLKVGSIRISPYWIFPEAEAVEKLLNELGFSPYPNGSSARSFTGLVDLRHSTNQILASFSRRARYQIRLADRRGVSVRPATDLDEALLAFRCLDQMRAERGITRMSYKEFYATFEHVLKEQEYGILLNSFIEDTFLGGLWIIRGIATATPSGYAIVPSASNKLPSGFSIGPSLWWQGIKWAKEKGCLWLDVGGYRDNADPSDARYLIYKFKKRFNPKPIDILAQHICVCSPVTYSIYKGYNFFFRGLNFTKSLPYHIKTRRNRQTVKKVASGEKQ